MAWLRLRDDSELFDDDSPEPPELELDPESEDDEEDEEEDEDDEPSEDFESLLDAAVSFVVLSFCSFISRERFLVP